MINAFTLHCGDSAEVLRQYPDNHFDSVVTDPPYGIDFLGKAWDANTGDANVYRECLRVLKPGGHILAFSAPRTYHHLAITLELVGFEIRDQIMWIYSSGFPKSVDVGRSIQRRLGVEQTRPNLNHRTKSGNSLYQGGHQKTQLTGDVVCTDPVAKLWEGWGTNLKPAHEPICMARKPIKGSVIANVQTWGVGALNIDATRVAYDSDETVDGRFPSNVIGEIQEPYQKYFYCPKVSSAERNLGCETIEPKFKESANFRPNHLAKAIRGESGNPFGRYDAIQNNHPTVKPVELMKYLIRLVTPSGGLVLDPFNGSGSTGMAAVELGHTYVGIDLDQRYVDISALRIQAWHDQTRGNTFNQLFKES